MHHRQSHLREQDQGLHLAPTRKARREQANPFPRPGQRRLVGPEDLFLPVHFKLEEDLKVLLRIMVFRQKLCLKSISNFLKYIRESSLNLFIKLISKLFVVN